VTPASRCHTFPTDVLPDFPTSDFPISDFPTSRLPDFPTSDFPTSDFPTSDFRLPTSACQSYNETPYIADAVSRYHVSA
jgi:hypothetical protein